MTPFFEGFPGPVDPNEEAEAKRVPVKLRAEAWSCLAFAHRGHSFPSMSLLLLRHTGGLRIGFPCRDYFSFTGEAPGGFLLLILSHLETTIMQKTFLS